nr:DUF6098 family protein [Microbacterium sp. MAH-37]
MSHGVRAGGELVLPVIDSLAQLEDLVWEMPGLGIRYSAGWDHDRDEESIDHESGLPLPGLSVNPLDPEPWWDRPLRQWLARQLCQYRHLAEEDDDRHAWILAGRLVARGPDCEPLFDDVEPVADLAPEVIAEAERVYAKHFAVGRGPTD